MSLRTHISTLKHVPMLDRLDKNIENTINTFRLYDEHFFGFTTDDRVIYLLKAGGQTKEIKGLAGKKIIDIVRFDKVFLALSILGQVLSFLDFDEAPTIIIEVGVISLKSSDKLVLALKKYSEVFAWGDSKILGFEKLTTSVIKPTVIETLNNANIIDIECGSSHLLALSQNGTVYGWGSNTMLQLGILGKSDQIFVPKAIPIEEPIRSIRCGSFHSFFLTVNGALYITGKGYSCMQKISNYFYVINWVVIPYFYHDKEDNAVLVVGHSSRAELFTIGVKSYDVDPDKYLIHGRALPDVVMEYAKYKTIPAVVKVIRKGNAPVGQIEFIAGKPSMKIELNSCQSGSQIEVNKPNTSKLISKPPKLSASGTSSNPTEERIHSRVAKIAAAFDKPDTADVIFAFPRVNKSIHAHRCILSITSDYLKERFTTRWCGLTKIEITDQPYASFYQFLKYLYTDQIDQIDDSRVLLRLILMAKQANEFDVRLRSLCGSQLESRLDLVTCCSMFESAREFDLDWLEARVLAFIVDHFYEVITSDSYFQLKLENQKLINLRCIATLKQTTNKYSDMPAKI